MNSKELAWNIRNDAISMTYNANTAHIGSILSVTDLIAVLYADILNYNSENPKWNQRDRFILSKGHSGAALYSALSHCGFFSRDELKQYCKNGSNLSGHVSSFGVNGVEISTGSLGHGLSIGAGMALAGKLDKKDYNVFVILGDGECNEGSVWESIMFAKQQKLDNLIAIIDFNKLQGLGRDVLCLDPLYKKLESFGWNVKVINGHDHDEIRESLNYFVNNKNSNPSAIIANTIKGKGISFMENKLEWHYHSVNDFQYEDAINELKLVKP